MSEKVTYKELRNAVVHVDNSVDVSKTYEIAADVRINSTSVESYENGTVSKDNVAVATFNAWDGNIQNLNINFQGIESEDQCPVLEALGAFFTDVASKVSSSSIPLNL